MTMPPSERHNQHLTDAELNELVDGTLPASEAAAARAHLASCSECEERFLTLQATVSALQHAPSLQPRRSFQLTPEQAQLPEKKPGWLDRFAQRIVPGIPAIRAATVAVALLLVSVTAIDVITHRDDSADQSPVAQMREPVETELPTSEADRAAEPTQVEATEAPLLGAANEAVSTDVATGGSEADEAESGVPQGGLGAAGAPAAPAPASVPGEEAADQVPAMFEAAATESPATASPLAAPTAMATPLASATAAATPVPAASEETSGGGGSSISRWRIAELGLLLLLLWLIVSWVGRSRVGDHTTAPPSP